MVQSQMLLLLPFTQTVHPSEVTSQLQAVRRACKALLLCPWSLGIRLQAASCAAAHHTGGSSSAAQLCFGIACLRLQQLPCSYNPSPTGGAGYL